jgi:F-type H+-transporting ATPase subunit delta
MASEHDTSLAAADIYAESLLELANERGVAAEIFTEFQSLVDIIDRDADFAGFMTSSAVDDDDRREALQRIFRGRISELLLNLMLVLNDHDRAGIVPLVFDRFKHRLDEQLNRQDVYVTSAVPLDNDQRARIETGVSATMGKSAVLIERVDAALLGGVVIKIGDRQFDGSLKSKLAGMREHVIEAGRQEILSGKHTFWVE